MFSKKNKGQALVSVTVCLFCILGLMALVMDTGLIYLRFLRIQRAVDSASLAAAQDLPISDREVLPYEVAYEASEFNKVDRKNIEVQFTAPPGQTRLNTVSVTATEIIPTRLAMILGYDEWPIAAQSIARSGPIAASQHWIPIGALEEPQDMDQGVELYEYIRLGNTNHTSANENDIKRLYVPLDHGNLASGVEHTIKSKLTVGQNIAIKQNYNIEDVCDGVDRRIKSAYGNNVAGCFKVDDEVIDTGGLNIIGPGSIKDWYYGEDPRLVYVPFVELIDEKTAKVRGFGLFYIAYAHFDTQPYGGEEPITEIVGYFVRTVVEGPVNENAPNYGVIGIEYVDPSKL